MCRLSILFRSHYPQLIDLSFVNLFIYTENISSAFYNSQVIKDKVSMTPTLLPVLTSWTDAQQRGCIDPQRSRLSALDVHVATHDPLSAGKLTQRAELPVPQEFYRNGALHTYAHGSRQQVFVVAYVSYRVVCVLSLLMLLRCCCYGRWAVQHAALRSAPTIKQKTRLRRFSLQKGCPRYSDQTIHPKKKRQQQV